MFHAAVWKMVFGIEWFWLDILLFGTFQPSVTVHRYSLFKPRAVFMYWVAGSDQ